MKQLPTATPLFTPPPRQVNTSLLKICLLLVISLWASYVQAQERPMKVVYDENNVPSHIGREIIVRFDPAVLQLFAIDNTGFQSGPLSGFLKNTAVEQLSQVLGYQASQIATFKIFRQMTSADTLSTDRLGETIRIDDHWASLVLQLPVGSSEQSACDQLKTLFPLVRYAHLNRVGVLNKERPHPARPNDGSFAVQGSLQPTLQYPNGNINLLNAWLYSTGSSNITVGVYDSGIDANHPDLFSTVIKGRDFYNGTSRFSIVDESGHGTACAGIIAARRSNTTGVSGIAGGDYAIRPSRLGVNLADMKIFQYFPQLLATISAPNSVIADAIVQGAVRSPASTGYGYALDIMNHSWGSRVDEPVIRDAMRTAYRNKCIVVASRGNGPPQSVSVTSSNYPASYPDNWVISVGASGTDGEHKVIGNGNPGFQDLFDDYESSYGDAVDLIAPGTTALVYTTRSRSGSWGSGDYTAFNGTSAAAPHVAGVAALLLSIGNNPANPSVNLAPEDVEQLLQRSAKDKAPVNAANPYDNVTGWGLLDAGKAVDRFRPGVYRIVHDRATAATDFIVHSGNARISVPQGTVSANGTVLNQGVYTADVYRVVASLNPRRTGLVQPNETIVGTWARNSSSTPLTQSNPLSVEPGVEVLPGWNQSSVVAQGYCFRLKFNSIGQSINQWVPFDPSGPGAIFDVSYYAYNPDNDFPVNWRQATVPTNEQPGLGAKTGQPQAYPNPATAEVTIAYLLETASKKVTVEILALNGQVMQSMAQSGVLAGSHTVSLQTRELVPGFYTFRVITEQGVSVGKFIKQ